jgi:hypothetical protein
MRESQYQAQLIKKLNRRLPGCIILKNDPDYLQGVPDLLILFEDKWAALEVKISRTAPNQPNQTWYICEMNDMSFAAFIYPDIEEDGLDALQQALQPRRTARVPQRQ